MHRRPTHAKTDAPKTDAPKTDDKTKSGDKPADPKTTDDKSSVDRQRQAHHIRRRRTLWASGRIRLRQPAAPAPTTPAATTPAKTDTPKTDAPKTDTPKTDTPKTDTPKTDTPKTDTPKTDTPKTDAPKTDAPKTDTPKTDTPKSADASKTVEYDPVTDKKVRATIRTTLASQKAATEINEAFTKLRPAVQNYSRARSLWRAKGKHPDDEPPAPDFKDLAKTAGLSFEETKKVSAEEAKDTTDLGKSTQLDETNFRLVPFTQIAFDANLPDYMPSETASRRTRKSPISGGEATSIRPTFRHSRMRSRT